MQNAQIHQMVMQQMMLSAIPPKPYQNYPSEQQQQVRNLFKKKNSKTFIIVFHKTETYNKPLSSISKSVYATASNSTVRYFIHNIKIDYLSI